MSWPCAASSPSLRSAADSAPTVHGRPFGPVAIALRISTNSNHRAGSVPAGRSGTNSPASSAPGGRARPRAPTDKLVVLGCLGAAPARVECTSRTGAAPAPVRLPHGSGSSTGVAPARVPSRAASRRKRYLVPLPTMVLRSISLAVSSLASASNTVRRPSEALAAIVSIDGHASPAAFAMIVSTNSTALSGPLIQSTAIAARCRANASAAPDGSSVTRSGMRPSPPLPARRNVAPTSSDGRTRCDPS